MNEEIKKIIDHSKEFCSELLYDTGELYPFGAYIGIEGNVHPLEYEFDKKNMPTNGQVIESLEKYCADELVADRMRSYGLIYEVSMQIEKNSPEIDAICIDITECDGKKYDLLYIPYQIKGKSKVIFDEMFAVKR